ncbi:MAG: hypothetical protein ACK5AZ_08085 [Bryobacteraceae bacterium]
MGTNSRPEWYANKSPGEKVEVLTRDLEALTNHALNIVTSIKSMAALALPTVGWLRDDNPHNLEDDDMIPEAIEAACEVLLAVVLGRLEHLKFLLLDTRKEDDGR